MATRPLWRQASLSWLELPSFDLSLTLLGLCIFTVAIVTSRFPIGEIGIAIAAAGLVLQKSKFLFPAPVWLYGAFVAWAFVASLDSQYPYITDQQVLERLKTFVILVVVVNALRTGGQLRFFLLIFLASFMIYPARGALYAYSIGHHPFGRAVWNYIYENSNDLATLSLLALGVALSVVFSGPARNVVRVVAGLSGILLLIVILLTQSRGAVIGLAVGMGPALVGLAFRRPVRATVAAGILILIAGFTIPATVWERLAGIGMLTSSSTIALADPEGSAEQRFAVQKVALQIIVDHPVFGVGLGAYPLENAKYAPNLGRLDTHNTYFNLAAEVGLPGLAIWCAFVLSVLRYAYRQRRASAPGEIATQQAWLERAVWAYLIAALFGSYAKLTFPYLMLAVVWCSATLLTNPSQDSKNIARRAKA